MVANMNGRNRIITMLSVLVAALAWPQVAALAAVVASVDRANVELNESFTLKVTVDTAIDVEPDHSALDEDFYVGTRSQLSNTTIVNGQISRSRTWTYVLMAKREGDLEIPPIRIGSELSEPVPIRVLPPSTTLPGEADIFVTTEVDHSESFVQAQVLYRVKVYRAVATRQPRLSEPSIGGVEVLIESAGEERSYESILNGKAYNVVERVYALFPQESGSISIEPARFEARVLRDGRITGRKIFESEAIEVIVNPIPAPPADFPDAVWFPAKSVTLTEDWSREPSSLPAGEPITRHIIVTAVGQLSTQIPVIEPASSDRIKVYPDKPEFRDTAEASGIRAVRRDQYAMIGVSDGEVELPSVDLPWWNIDTGAWEVASLPLTVLKILPSANAEPLPPPVEQPVEAESPATETEIVYVDFWRYVPGNARSKSPKHRRSTSSRQGSSRPRAKLPWPVMLPASSRTCWSGHACSGRIMRRVVSVIWRRGFPFHCRPNCRRSPVPATGLGSGTGMARHWRSPSGLSRC